MSMALQGKLLEKLLLRAVFVWCVQLVNFKTLLKKRAARRGAGPRFGAADCQMCVLAAHTNHINIKCYQTNQTKIVYKICQKSAQ